jgi:hypothetical protein
MERFIVAIRNMVLTIFLILIVGTRLVADSAQSKSIDKSDCKIVSESENTAEIQCSTANFLTLIEINGCSRIITEVHRLVTVSILSNRIVPICFNFRSNILTPIITNFSSPVPIFIKGHALLN